MSPRTSLEVPASRSDRRSRKVSHGLEVPVPSEAHIGTFQDTLFEEPHPYIEPRPYIADDQNCMGPNNGRDAVEIKRIPTIEIQDYDSQALHGESVIHGYMIKQEYPRSESYLGQAPGYPNMLHDLSAFSRLENPDVSLPSPIEDLGSGSWDFLTPSLALSPSERSTSSRRTTLSSVRSDSQTRHVNEGPERCPLRRCRHHRQGFARSSDRDTHIVSWHFSDTIVCAFCPGTTTIHRPYEYKRHITRTHGYSDNPMKTIDSTKFTTLDAANEHNKFGRCSICATTYPNVKDFLDHLDECFLRAAIHTIEKKNETQSISDGYTTDDEIVADFGITTLRDVSNSPSRQVVLNEMMPIWQVEQTRLEFDPENRDREKSMRPEKLTPEPEQQGETFFESRLEVLDNEHSQSEKQLLGSSQHREPSSMNPIVDMDTAVEATAEPTSTPDYANTHNWQSADDMTDSPRSEDSDSPFSGDETEWEDSQGDSTVYRQLHMITHANILDATEDGKTIIAPTLSPLKRALIDRIMDEFWVVFNQGWTANITKHTDDSVSTVSPASPRYGAPTASNSNAGKKRSRNDREDSPSDDANGQPPKKPRSTVTSTRDGASLIQLACPFRKHDPRKYGINEYRSCALSYWSSVGRVKEHLYRRHRIPIRCTRCWTRFKSQNEKDSHLDVVNICAIQCRTCGLQLKSQEEIDSHYSLASLCASQPGQEIEGISDELERQLRSRKKSSRNPSQEDRWRDMYQLIFPDEIIPTPYFEPIQDEAAQSPDSHDLAQYEEFSRRELPRFFRNYVEEAFKSEAQPLEERLLSRLFTMIQDCQDRVFASYRTQFVSTPNAESLISATGAGEGVSSRCEDLQASSTSAVMALHPTSIPPTDNILASVYPLPPTQTYAQPELHDQAVISNRPAFQQVEQQKFSDSGYDSDTLITCKCTDLCSCGIAQSPLESMGGPSRHQGQLSGAVAEEHIYSDFDSGISEQLPFYIPSNPADPDWDKFFEVGDTHPYSIELA